MPGPAAVSVAFVGPTTVLAAAVGSDVALPPSPAFASPLPAAVVP